MSGASNFNQSAEPSEATLSRAVNFLTRLENKIVLCAKMIRKRNSDQLIAIRSELKVYANQLDTECRGAIGESASEMTISLRECIAKIGQTSLINKEASKALIEDLRSLVGSVRANIEIIRSRMQSKARKILSVLITIASVIPIAAIGPELVTGIILMIGGYFGLTGTGAEFIMRGFRRKNRRAIDTVDDTHDA